MVLAGRVPAASRSTARVIGGSQVFELLIAVAVIFGGLAIVGGIAENIPDSPMMRRVNAAFDRIFGVETDGE